MSTITIDNSKIIGKIKPMHAVNNIPITSAWTERVKDYTGTYIKDAGIPFVRFHDTGGVFGAGVYIDIENVFRNFDADENDPASYDFTFTDWIIDRVESNGIKTFYRLGTTIENSSFIKAYRIYPPKDNAKWARICEHIILHYNEGWADGFHYDIEYWEIWNEPDGDPDMMKSMTWRGTAQQYFELYEVAANHLKNRFPNLKIGGYASCGFYKIAQVAANPNANVSERVEYFVTFFHDFMKYISNPEHKSPLDFFSWHTYSDVKQNIIYCDYVREQLDNYGFKGTESICNEWNPGLANKGKLRDANRIAVNMLAWHKHGLDMAMYYDMKSVSSYCGAFDPITLLPFKAYYAFKAFNVLYRLGEEVESGCDNEEIYYTAATNGKKTAVMLAGNTDSDEQVNINLNGFEWKKATLCTIDEEHDLEEKQIFTDKVEFVLAKDSVAVVEFE